MSEKLGNIPVSRHNPTEDDHLTRRGYVTALTWDRLTSTNSTLILSDDTTDQTLTGNLGDIIITPAGNEVVITADLVPAANSAYDLGEEDTPRKWRTVYCNSVEATGDVDVGDDLSVTGEGKFSNGLEATPSITFSVDLNTGFWRKTDDTIAISTGGTERLSISTTDVAVTLDTTFEESVIVGNSTGSHGVLRVLGDPGSPVTGRGGVIEWAGAFSSQSVNCYTFANNNKRICFKDSAQSHGLTDDGNAWIECDTGEASFGPITVTDTSADPDITFVGNLTNGRIILEDATSIFLFTQGLAFGNTIPTGGFFGQINTFAGADSNDVEIYLQGTVSAADTDLGAIKWRGGHAANAAGDYAAGIMCFTDAAWDGSTAHDMPARIEFYTQSDGSGDALTAPRMTIDSAGSVNIGDASNYVEIDATGDVTFVGGAGLAFAGISASDVSATITIAASGQANRVQVTAFDTDDPSNDMTPDHTNDHITVDKAGMYLCTVSATLDSVAGSSAQFAMALYKNNGATEFPNVHVHRDLSAGAGGNSGSVSMSGIVDLAASDTIEVWLWNETNTQNVVVDDISLALVQIGGT